MDREHPDGVPYTSNENTFMSRNQIEVQGDKVLSKTFTLGESNSPRYSQTLNLFNR